MPRSKLPPFGKRHPARARIRRRARQALRTHLYLTQLINGEITVADMTDAVQSAVRALKPTKEDFPCPK